MPGWGGPLNVPFKNSAITSHMESIALLILSGQYFGYLPAHFAAQWVDRGEMRCLLDFEDVLSRQVLSCPSQTGE